MCYSCHPGGGPAEGIVQPDGTVTPYDDPSLQPTHTYDRDFYSYGPDVMSNALNSGRSIEETVAASGEPKRVDWQKSGVMEADCLFCHIDPEGSYKYTAADGFKVQTFRPRLMIFARRDEAGAAQVISLGMAIDDGLRASTAFAYTNPAQRMSRPTPLFTLARLPKENVGEMMEMWVNGLKMLEEQGINLPYALYAPPEVVPGIWGQHGIKPEFCANPAGPADEMQRLMAAKPALDQMFAGFLEYMKANGFLPPEAGMGDMMQMFFNDFIYAYQIKWPMGSLVQVPFPLRGYKTGAFYSDWDNADGSVRDYLRAPVIEGDAVHGQGVGGEGVPYSGLVGQGYGAMLYAVGRAMQGDPTYMRPDGNPDISKVMADMQSGAIPAEHVPVTMRQYLPGFFSYMPTANLMGIDLNGDNAPLTYVQLVRNGDDWEAKAYYNTGDLGDGSIRIEMFGGPDDVESPKWVKVCGQCHAMTQDHGNSEWTRVRLYNLGMGADWVKNGRFVNITDNEEAPGYEVHLSGGKMGCGSCHLRTAGDVETKHNFLKGTDTAHMVRNDLDNNPKPKSCEYCHLYGGDLNAPNPAYAHEEKFGENTGRHLAAIDCEVCHIPYRRTWRFRAFDDTLGYYGNFDNRFGFNVLPGGDGTMMAFPPEYAISPVYGVSPGYGIPHFHMVAQHIDADGSGQIVPMDYVSQMVDYFNLNGEADPGRIVNGMPTNMKFDFWKYFYQMSLQQAQQMGVPLSFNPEYDNENIPPLYYANGRNGYPQITIGNPITILTWVDVNPQPDHDMSDIAYGGAKVLYLREINAAIDKFWMPVALGRISPQDLAAIPANDPGYAANPYVGKIVLKDSGYVIFDHTGDMYPDLWWPEDVRAMQEALTKVLKAEGETDPKPVLFMAAHYFSDSHGVQPKEKALGAQSCNDCHGDYTKDAGAHRITDRVVTFLPWAPPWFADENRFLRYAPEEVSADAPIWMKRAGMVVNNPDGFFVVDGEIAYAKPIQANNMSFIGARQDDILALSHHHAEELFYMTSLGTVKGEEIEGIDHSLLSAEELETEYAMQMVNSVASQVVPFYVPEHMKAEIAEMGFLPTEELIYVSGYGMFPAFVAAVGINGGMSEPCIIRLPFQGGEAAIVSKDAGSASFFMDNSAVVVGHSGPYLLVKVTHNGEYAAVERAAATSGINAALWNAFMEP